MHSKTVAALEELRAVNWFANVGQAIDERVVQVLTWETALEYCSTQIWDDLLLEASNHLAEAVHRASHSQFQKWNDLSEEIMTVVRPLATQKAEVITRKYNPNPKMFVGSITWTLGHALLECEYSDLGVPGFFGALASWYLKGHFPCGWRCANGADSFPEGTMPDGVLVVL